jgi:hypothetical protein
MAKQVMQAERAVGTQYQTPARGTPSQSAAGALGAVASPQTQAGTAGAPGAVARSEPQAGTDGQAGTPEQIAILAYEIWVARGRPHGTDLEDWYEAERQLCERRTGQA